MAILEDGLSEDEFTKILEAKRRGNEAFQAGDMTAAEGYYEEALAVYDMRLGTGAQRETKVTLLSNFAEANLRLEDYDRAEMYATQALEMDENCVKARVRRVKAGVARLEEEGLSSSQDPSIVPLRRDIERIREQLPTNPAISHLTRRIDAMVKKKTRDETSSRKGSQNLMRDYLAQPSNPEDVAPFEIPTTTSPRVRVDEPLLSAVQAAVDSAAPGTLVELCAGVFADTESLILRKPLFLVGAGKDQTIIDAKLLVQPVSDKDNKVVTIKGVRVKQGALFLENSLDRIDVVDSHFELYTRDDDCLEFKDTPAKILVSGSTIIGGSDGLTFIGHKSKHVHIYKSTIHSAASRGIFADPPFVIEDSTVTNCGGYGMKTRNGCTRRGKNNIQPGPWDQLADQMNGIGGSMGGGFAGMGGFF